MTSAKGSSWIYETSQRLFFAYIVLTDKKHRIDPLVKTTM